MREAQSNRRKALGRREAHGAHCSSHRAHNAAHCWVHLAQSAARAERERSNAGREKLNFAVAEAKGGRSAAAPAAALPLPS